MAFRISFASVFGLSLILGACNPEGPPTPIQESATNDNAPPKTPIADVYRPVADQIIDAAMAGNEAYAKLQYLCDHIGHRLSGSPALEKAVQWAVNEMKADGQENVRAEPVMVPKWVRGRESARMVAPREYDLHMLGLGMSVGTGPDGITAPVVCVCNEAEFEALGEKANGKIVLFNNPMQEYDPEHGAGYGTAVRFRGRGPSMAAKNGAVACLVRSVTANSLRSPHTGATRYEDGVPKIPAAAITTEDADLISRLLASGEEVRLHLRMDARDEGMVPSANVVGELRGREKPEEVLVIGGHIDSWDVGDGAHDDGGGCVIAMEAINVLRKLNLRPRRTIRVVLWTNEENGLGGGKRYAVDHADELKNHIGAIESDSGVFSPRGIGVSCNDERRHQRAIEQVGEILALLRRVAPVKVEPSGGGADISTLASAGVVLMGFEVEGSTYFDYHHTHADTLDKVDPKELDQCVAVLATVSFILADMPDRLGN